MIKGLSTGYTGKVYIYYKGPYRVVLSDVNAGFAGKDFTESALRIVLEPNTWVETDYANIKSPWEKGSSQLNYLERDGYVDIYTDPKDVEEAKVLLSGGKQEIPTVEESAKYFDLAKLPTATTVNREVKTEKNNDETVNTLLAFVKQQTENSNKQNEQMMKLMETTQQMMMALVSQIKK